MKRIQVLVRREWNRIKENRKKIIRKIKLVLKLQQQKKKGVRKTGSTLFFKKEGRKSANPTKKRVDPLFLRFDCA
jgi:hypothetical protein